MAGKASKKSSKESSPGDLSASERIDGAIAGLGDWRGRGWRRYVG